MCFYPHSIGHNEQHKFRVCLFVSSVFGCPIVLEEINVQNQPDKKWYTLKLN